MSHLRSRVAEDLNVSGVKHIAGGSKAGLLRRTMWFLVVAGATGWMFYNLYRVVIYFTSNPMTVDLRYKYLDEIPFPAITICNKNYIRATGLFHVGHEGRPDPLYPQPGMEFINIYLVMHDLAELNQDVQLSSEEKVQILVNKYEEEVSWAEPVDYKWYLEMNAHHMDEMLAGCEWEGRPCNASDFEPVLTNAGLCYVFNGDRHNRRTVRYPGASGGLSLLLNTQQYEYTTREVNSAGFRVLVHDQSDNTQLLKDTSLSVDYNSEVDISVSLTNHTYLGQPYTDCNETHGYSWCAAECMTSYILEECGCLDVWMNPPDNVTLYCSAVRNLACCWPKTAKFAHLSVSEVPSYCRCAEGCYRKKFTTSVSAGSLSTFDSWRLSQKYAVNPTILDQYVQGRLLQDWAMVALADWSYEYSNTNYATRIRSLTVSLHDFEAAVNSTEALLRRCLNAKNSTDGTDNTNRLLVTIYSFVSNVSHLLSFSPIMSRSSTNMFDIRFTHDVLSGEFVFRKLLAELELPIASLEAQVAPIMEDAVKLCDSTLWGDAEAEERNGTVTASRTTHNSWSQLVEMQEMYANLQNLSTWLTTDILKDLKISVAYCPWSHVIDPSTVRDNFARVKIYMAEVAILNSVQQVAFSTEAFFCDIGGSLGLYLGASILTVVELLDILFGIVSAVIIRGPHKTENRKVSRQSSSFDGLSYRNEPMSRQLSATFNGVSAGPQDSEKASDRLDAR